MGKRGPARTPKSQLAARGSWRAKERSEPAIEAGAPPAPGWFNDLRKSFWDYYCNELAKMNLLATCDLAHVAALCDACADHEEAAAIVAAEGAYFETDKGFMGKHPAFAAKQQARADMVRIAQQLGLSPSSRTTVTQCPTAKDDQSKASKFGIIGA